MDGALRVGLEFQLLQAVWLWVNCKASLNNDSEPRRSGLLSALAAESFLLKWAAVNTETHNWANRREEADGHSALSEASRASPPRSRPTVQGAPILEDGEEERESSSLDMTWLLHF